MIELNYEKCYKQQRKRVQVKLNFFFLQSDQFSFW